MVAQAPDSDPRDPDLAYVLAALPHLPDVVLARLRGIIEGAALGEG